MSLNPINPIPFIYFDQNKTLNLSQQALTLFKSLTTNQLHIITVAGKYRTGKSYILNRVLLGRNNGFKVGSTINACTKGLWIWPQIVKMNDGSKIKDCLIIDTEGLGSLQQGENTDIKIFMLAILLSSYLIYNSVGSIDQKAIENLGLVVNLANLLQKQNNNYDLQEIIHSFPTFLWLVRDFSLRLENQNGQKITTTQYLENALKIQPAKTQAMDRKNQVRKQLRTFFPNRDCFTLIRPTQNEKDLQNLSSLSDSKLRPQFVDLINSLKSKIFHEVKPKSIKGKSITCQGFIQLSRYYIQAINSGKLPSINSHWQNLCLNQSKKIIESYKMKHKLRLIQAANDQIHKVNSEHNIIIKQASQNIDKSFLGKLQKQLTKEKLKKELTEIKDELIKQIQEENHIKVKIIISKIFQEIIRQFKNKEIESFEQIFQRFQNFKHQYSHDPNIYQLFYENSKDVFVQFINTLQQSWQTQNSILIYKTQTLQNQILSNSSQLQKKIQDSNKLIRQYQNQLYKLKVQNQNIKNQNQYINKKVKQIQKQKNELLVLYENRCLENEANCISLKQQLIKKYQLQKNQISKEKHNLQIQLAKLEQLYRTICIKQRKACRQGQIIKNKCTEYLSQNYELNSKIEELQKNIQKLQQNLRKNKINMANQDIPSIVVQLNMRVKQLQLQVKNIQMEKKNIIQTLEDQKKTNQTLLKVSKNLNYISMKKSFQIQKKSNFDLKAKIKELQILISYSSTFQCRYCGTILHQNQVISHHIFCVQERYVQFDVSYSFNTQGQVQFLIEIKANNQQWSVSKSIKAIILFLQKIQVLNELFYDEQNQNINIYQKQRIFLTQLMENLSKRMWQQIEIIKFLALDIHVLRAKKRKHQKLMQIDVQNIYDDQKYNLCLKTSRGPRKTFKHSKFL